MIDGHVHLENGTLTKKYVYELIESARKRGIDELQILDHAFRFKEFRPAYEKYRKIEPQVEWLDSSFKDSINDYISLIEEMKKEKLSIQVKFGLEICYQREDEEILKKLLSIYNWDFIIGSVHAIDHIAYDSKWSLEYLWHKYDADYIYRIYYEEMFNLIESGLFSQLGHPDTIKMFNIYPSYDLTDTYNKLASLLNKHNMLVENNVGCFYRYHHKDKGLSNELLEILKNNHCKLITCSDAHYPEHVGIHIKDIYDKTYK